MRKREDGFTLVELIITLTMTMLFLTAVSTIFTNLLTQFKQQSKIAESNIEGLVGLEIMRKDMGGAGYGLPWDLQTINYNEAVDDSNTPWDDTTMNDAPNPPAALRSRLKVSMNASSDVLSVKSVSVAQNSASQKWTQLALNNIKKNGLSGDSFVNTDLVTVLYATSDANGLPTRVLIHDKAATPKWGVAYANTGPLAPGPDPGVGLSTITSVYPEIGATNTLSVFVIYGIDPGTSTATLRMPFNRADFYVRTPNTNFPTQCATGTGILYKGVISHSDGKLNELPLLDCVAAMHVTFALDVNNDGNLTYSEDISGLTAADVRAQLREVRVYILAQEGQRDLAYSYTYPGDKVKLAAPPDSGPSRDIDMTKITNYQNYRWKQYTFVVRPRQT